MSLNTDPRSVVGRRVRDSRRLDLGEVVSAFGSAESAELTHVGLDAPHGFVVVPVDGAEDTGDAIDLPIRGDLIASAPAFPRDVELDPAVQERIREHFSGEAAAVVLSEEHLDVTTRSVETERVRLRKEVVEEQVMVPVTLRRERLVVDRAPVAPGTEAGPGTPFAPAEPVEWTLWADEPVVTTRAVPVERVRLRKETDAGEETVTETLRRERAAVDRDSA